MSIFSDHIFNEIALVVSHVDGLGNKDCHQQYCHLQFCWLYNLSIEWLA